MFRLHYFKDKRYRRERIMWVAGLALLLMAVVGIVAMLYLTQDLPGQKDASAQSPSGPPGSGVGLPGAVKGAAPDTLIAAEAPPAPAPSVSDRSRERIAEALLAFKSGDRAAAGNLLSGVDLSKAAFAPAWELAGMLQEHAGDRQAAMEIYSQGIASAPSEGLYYRRAILRRDSGQLDLALEDMEHATARPPLHPVLSNERLLLLLQMGRRDQAAEELQALDASDADSSGWIFARCGMALESGAYEDAGRLLAAGKNSVAPAVFQQMLKNPVLSRHQSRPEIMPFYFSNLKP